MTPRMRRLAAGYLEHSGRILVILVVAGLGAMLLLNGTSVVLRTVGLRSIHWAHEVSLVIATSIYYLGYGLVVRSSAEIRVQFAVQGLPARSRQVLNLVGDAAQFALYVTFGILLTQYAIRMSPLSMPVTRLSEALLYAPAAVGLFDASIVVLLRTLTHMNLVEAQPLPPEIKE